MQKQKVLENNWKSEINQCNEGITKQKKEYLLEELSHYIKDGEKCPLCGNIHPSYVFSNKEEALGASLKDKTNELKRSERKATVCNHRLFCCCRLL